MMRRSPTCSNTNWFLITHRALCSPVRWKTEGKILLSHIHIIIICVIGQFLHSTAANYAYLRHKPSEPLDDLGFEVIPPIHGSLRDVSEIICLGIVASAFLLSFTLFFYTPPPVPWASIILRVMLVMTMATLLRCICFLSTRLPGPAPHCLPGSTEYHPPRTMHELLWRKVIFKGCGDLIFSSHTALSMMFILPVHRYLHLVMERRKSRVIIYGLYWPLLVVQSVFIIGSRKHYTVDVVVALFTTPFLWKLSFSILPEMKGKREGIGVLPSMRMIKMDKNQILGAVGKEL